MTREAGARVAMLGSCVTRDIWKLPRFTDADRKSVFVLARTSLASLCAEPLDAFVPPAELAPGLSPFEVRMVGHDLLKTGLAALVAHRPTHLVIDFIDERFDLLVRGGQVATRSLETSALGLDGRELAGFRPVARHSDEARRLWRRGLSAFAAFARTQLPGARIILHDARCAVRGLAETGATADLGPDWEFWPGQPASIARLNDLLGAYAEDFRQALPEAAVVRAPADVTLADAGHRWGLAPFHYVEAYYEAVLRQLEPLGCIPGGEG